MMSFRRLALIALSLAVPQFPLTGASAHCASHRDTVAAAAMDDMAMPMAGMPADKAADGNGCDHCGTGGGQVPPCDHAAALGACGAMGSCGATSSLVASAASVAGEVTRDAIPSRVYSPLDPSLPQDTPPPRA